MTDGKWQMRAHQRETWLLLSVLTHSAAWEAIACLWASVSSSKNKEIGWLVSESLQALEFCDSNEFTFAKLCFPHLHENFNFSLIRQMFLKHPLGRSTIDTASKSRYSPSPCDTYSNCSEKGAMCQHSAMTRGQVFDRTLEQSQSWWEQLLEEMILEPRSKGWWRIN